jgi:apolipoprotein D and lipocalin family protein
MRVMKFAVIGAAVAIGISYLMKEITGKLKFAGDEEIGMLKASYFGPFYLSYNVLAIDPDYQHALVSGSGLDYLWLLSRDKAIPGDIKQQFLDTAKHIGFDINKLEWV